MKNEDSGRESESVRYVEESSGRGVERQLAERKDGRSFTDSMNRIYMGIDVGKKSHHATVLGCTGQVEEQFQFANTRRGFDGMVSRIQVYQGRGFRVLVGMDATGCYWYSLYSFLSRHLDGESVKVVNPLQLGRYRKLLIRKTKTDEKDSELIARLLIMNLVPQTELLAGDTLKLRQLAKHRFRLADEVGNKKKRLRSVLAYLFPEFEQVFRTITSKGALHILSRYPDPAALSRVSERGREDLVKDLARISRTPASNAAHKLDALMDAARRSIGVSFLAEPASLAIRQTVTQLEILEQQIGEVDHAMNRVLENNYLWPVLQKRPGIGPVIAGTIIGMIGDPSRFAGRSQVVAYAGMDLAVYQSGSRSVTRKLTKRGSPLLRRVLYLAAARAATCDQRCKDYLQKKLGEGKHYKSAVTALARRMIEWIYSDMVQAQKQAQKQAQRATKPVTERPEPST